MRIQTITVYFRPGHSDAVAWAFAVGPRGVTGKAVASLTFDSALSADVKQVFCSQRTKEVIVDPLTGQTDMLSVYQIEVRLWNPAPPGGYVQVNVFDENYDLGHLGLRSKFSAWSSNFWESNNGIRFQFSGGGFDAREYRHLYHWGRDENANPRLLPQFEQDAQEFLAAHPDHLVFLGDENSADPNHITPLQFADLYERFYDIVKEKSGGRAKTSIGGEATGAIEDGSWLMQVRSELTARRPNTKWFDEWRFHALDVLNPVWKSIVGNAAAWCEQQGVPMILGSFAVDPGQHPGVPLSTILTKVREAMLFVHNDHRIVDAVWWHYDKDVCLAERVVPGADSFRLTPYGEVYKEMHDSFARLSAV